MSENRTPGRFVKTTVSEGAEIVGDTIDNGIDLTAQTAKKGVKFLLRLLPRATSTIYHGAKAVVGASIETGKELIQVTKEESTELREDGAKAFNSLKRGANIALDKGRNLGHSISEKVSEAKANSNAKWASKQNEKAAKQNDTANNRPSNSAIPSEVAERIEQEVAEEVRSDYDKANAELEAKSEKIAQQKIDAYLKQQKKGS